VPITEEKFTKRRKYRVKTRVSWQTDMKLPKTLVKDEYVVTCGERVTGRDVWRNEHERLRKETLPEGALNATILIDVEPLS
jgi:hypothetical protein